jgi:hypothetical protein
MPANAFADKPLIVPILVHSRRIEMSRANFNCAPNRCPRFRIITPAVPADEAHASQTDRSHPLISIPQCSLLHAFTPLLGYLTRP